ncbi:MAG: hypothetical protein LPK04_12870 [Caulobacteraceae bacterium]|nr:hypothetical protein [Caulobacteraceae bacterium]
MIRFVIALAFGLTLGSVAVPGAAQAYAAQVEVRLGPELKARAEETYGLDEIERLAETLRRDVERELDLTGVMAGGRVELVLTDAKPSRPTLRELAARPGLSFRSFAIGGAAIEGRTVTFDGKTMPISYSWYASDITDSRRQSVWGDAEWTFQRFAHRLSRGELYALR